MTDDNNVIDLDADRSSLDALRRAQTLTLELRDLIGRDQDTLALLDALNGFLFHVESAQIGCDDSAEKAVVWVTRIVNDGRWFADAAAVRSLLAALRDEGVDLRTMDPVHALVASTLRGAASADDFDVDLAAVVERQLTSVAKPANGLPALERRSYERGGPHFVLPPWDTVPEPSPVVDAVFAAEFYAEFLRDGTSVKLKKGRTLRSSMEFHLDRALDNLSDKGLLQVASAWGGSDPARVFSVLQQLSDVVDVGPRVQAALARRGIAEGEAA